MQHGITQQLVDIYYSSRPNLDLAHTPFSIFFFACSGAGKSTIRRRLVDEIGATYVCNDEVRELLDAHPEADRAGVEIKHIVAETVKKIIAEADNKLVVFDNMIVKYYMHDDSYLNVSRRQHIPDFVIGIDTPGHILAERIKTRGVNVEQILGNLPEQLHAYELATKDIVPDFVLVDTYDEDAMKALTDRVRKALH